MPATASPPTRRRPPLGVRRLTTVAGAAITALLLAACAGASGGAQVASIPTHGGRQVTTATTADQGIPDPDGRPRETLDQTSHQLIAMVAPFDTCVFARHDPLPKNSGYDARLLAATNACIKLAPLPAWPLDPANPQARAFIGQTVTCLQQQGYHAQAALSHSPFGAAIQSWMVAYTPAIVGIQAQTEAAQQACERHAEP